MWWARVFRVDRIGSSTQAHVFNACRAMVFLGFNVRPTHTVTKEWNELLVFIDESGDPGFKTDIGSSPVFVVAMVIFDTAEDAVTTEAVISELKRRLGLKTEFKFNRCRTDLRDIFFQAVKGCPFIVRAVVVSKANIRSAHLKDDKEDFYRFFLRQMMNWDGGILQDAVVVIDGSGDRQFREMLASSLRKHLGRRIKKLRFSESHRDILIQLADMCVGAIARSYRQDRIDAERWRKMLKPRISDVWDFK